MKTLGIDIGTTTISAAVLEDGQFLASETRANGAFIPSALTCAREQDVEKITQTALSVIETLFERYPDIHSIGVTGQMHGILYVDADGNAVSPLYTWQDARGSLPHSKTESWVQYLTRETGCLAAVGFGLATHAYNLAAGLVPPAAVTCCTIGDYLAMRLCGLAAPRMDDSNAASSNDDSSAVVNSGDDGSISGAADGKEPPQMPPDTENGSDMQPSQDFDPENAPSDGNAPQDFDPGTAPSDGDAPQKMQGGPGGGGNSELYIKIAGGTLTVSADGDGLDSNGGFLVTGGTTIVYGPTSDGDSALDYDGSAIVSGGILAAIGSAGMVESFDEASTQPVVTYYCTETKSADTIITLTDSDGSALFTVTPEKAYASIVLTCPEMKLDATYTLAVGTDNEEITLTDIITTAGTRSVKTMSDPEGGKMPNNSDNKGTPPSKPSNTAE